MKLRIVLAFAISTLAAAPLAAQTTDRSSGTNHNQNGSSTATTTATKADSSKAYDSQALRFESSWGSADIMRGAKGEVLGTVGWFRHFDTEKLVQSSPQAAAAAHDFQVSNFRGSLVSTIGASLVAIGIAVASNNGNNASTPVLIIAGAGGIGWGLQHINSSYAALSRALWWYNRDIGR
ncbi:MAG TPA: hypothetical protein VJ840_18180 [Gemmatimonadaceae bacterium]|nr:hypothetical protein [Gemmatimonadaceae bacterium]